jgi:hypothetical protein
MLSINAAKKDYATNKVLRYIDEVNKVERKWGYGSYPYVMAFAIVLIVTIIFLK